MIAQMPDPRIRGYVAGVLSGEITAGRLVKLAAERHLHDLDTAAERGLRFNAGEANFAINFFEGLPQTQDRWAGQPLTLLPWQCFCVGSIFGWERLCENDWVRRYRSAWIETARKSGKTTLGAAFGLKLLVADGVRAAQVFSFANKLDQACRVHDEALRMRELDPDLKALLEARGKPGQPGPSHNIYDEATWSTFRPMAADARTEDGWGPSGMVYDEVHEARDRTLFDKFDTGTGAREKPLMVLITTAGDAGNTAGIAWELHQHSCKVLEGEEDDYWFAFIAALDGPTYDENGGQIAPGDDWREEAVWEKANPGLGVTQGLDDLRAKFRRAQDSPSAENSFKRYHLNYWVHGSTAWLPAGLWSAGGRDDWYGGGMSDELLAKYRGRPCYGGGDLSSVDDLTAAVFCFPMDDGTFHVLPFFWCPRRTAEDRQASRRGAFELWDSLGLMRITDGDSVDYNAVVDKIVSLRDVHGWEIDEIAFDPHNAMHVFTMLGEAGITVFPHRQGYLSMNDPIKQTEKLLLDKRLKHGGHRVLGWNVDNTSVIQDAADNKKFDKGSGHAKIDGSVGMAMAVGRALLAPGPSVYETRGMLRL